MKTSIKQLLDEGIIELIDDDELCTVYYPTDSYIMVSPDVDTVASIQTRREDNEPEYSVIIGMNDEYVQTIPTKGKFPVKLFMEAEIE